MIRNTCLLVLLLWIGLNGIAIGQSEYKINPDEQTSRLIQAVADDDIERVKEVLANGANARFTRSREGNLLHLAKSPDVAGLLIDKNVDINNQDQYGRTPLSKSVSKGKTALVELLLEKGADPELLKHKKPKPLIHIAAKKGHVEIVEMLLKSARTHDIEDENSVTPLHLASLNGKADVVKLLLKHRANPNALASNMTTPVHVAKTAEVLELLIKAGGYIDSRNELGATPLHFAVLKKRSDVVAALLRAGADANARLDDGTTTYDLLDQELLSIYKVLGEYGGDYTFNVKDAPENETD